jgi:hypothetical protein
MSNKPKSHDNHRVHAFLSDYYAAAEVCSDYPPIDDIFSGVLAAKTAGNTATRSLSRAVLFHILQRCPLITVAAAALATNNKYATSTIEGYAAAARVASRAIAGFIPQIEGNH